MKILIAEDDQTSSLLLHRMLDRWGYEVMVTHDGDEAWRVLKSPDAPRLAILDWMMPGLNGIEVCRKVRDHEKGEEHYTYLILLTARDTRESIITGMEAGADDYVIKPFDQHELKVRVRAGQRIAALHAQLVEAKQELFNLARIDPLTGILNRRAIMAQLESEISRAARRGKAVNLSLLDIDYFKSVNDTHGHKAGDLVLCEVVKRIGNALRQYDSLGRFGGEEFLIIVPETDETIAPVVFERIRSAVGGAAVQADGRLIEVTVSQGVATWDGRNGIDDLIRAADEAVYRAKEKGRNRVEYAAAAAGRT